MTLLKLIETFKPQNLHEFDEVFDGNMKLAESYYFLYLIDKQDKFDKIGQNVKIRKDLKKLDEIGQNWTKSGQYRQNCFLTQINKQQTNDEKRKSANLPQHSKFLKLIRNVENRIFIPRF